MRLLANLLIVLGVVAGTLSTSTAYMVPLSLPEARLLTEPPLTLKSAAGRVIVSGEGTPDEKAEPIARKNEPLTPELLARLRDAGVRNVRVKEFSVARWPYAWLFGVGAASLLAGALLVRREAKASLAQTTAASAVAGGSPEAMLAATRETVERLRKDLDGADPAAQRAMIMERLEELQRTHLTGFVEQRAALVGQFGLGRYAAVMDRFAAGERQVNRAWSAAADGVEEESIACLEAAGPMFAEAEARLRG